MKTNIFSFIINIFLYLWQLPQILVAYMVMFFIYNRLLWEEYVYLRLLGNCTYEICRHKIYIQSKAMMGLSLGKYIFIFTNRELEGTAGFKDMLIHETRHSKQSLYLGPLYLILIGLPSILITSVAKNLARKWNM